MKKIISLLLLILTLLIFTGCDNVDLDKVSDKDLERISNKTVVCNAPYIRIGTSCCLDNNNNKICDEDENSINNTNNTNKTTDFSEEKLDLIIEEGTNTFTLNDKQYTLEVEEILSDVFYKVKLNGVEDSRVDLFEKNEFNGLYLFIMDTMVSSRDSVKSHGKIIITNYDYNLQIGDIKDCVSTESGGSDENSYEDGTTYGLNKEQDKIIRGKDVCKDSKKLIEYYCEDNLDEQEFVTSREVDCEYGCDSGRCLSISDVGCSQSALDSGIKSLGEGGKIEFDTTLIEVVEVGDGMAEIKIDGEKEFVEMCDRKTYGDLTILIHDTFESVRDNVKGYLEISYDYDESNEEIEDSKSCILGAGDEKFNVDIKEEFEVDSKEECIDIFEEKITNGNLFTCSETIGYREADYVETNDFASHERVTYDECENYIEDFDEIKIISFADGETKSITIGSKNYVLLVNGIAENGIVEIVANNVSGTRVEIFEQKRIGNLHFQILDNFISIRDSVKSYAQIAIGNYDFTLSSSDVNETCYENGHSSEEQTSVFAINSDNIFELKESYCLSNSTLTQYTCDGPDDGIEELEVDCEYGCESRRCLKITDVGCDKEELSSGIISIGDGDNLTLNNSSLLEVVEVGDGMAKIKVDGSREYVEMCKEETIGDLTILVHDTFESVREGVKGWMELSYN
jgi:hypothetical protein